MIRLVLPALVALAACTDSPGSGRAQLERSVASDLRSVGLEADVTQLSTVELARLKRIFETDPEGFSNGFIRSKARTVLDQR